MMESKDIFEEKCWLTKIGRESFLDVWSMCILCYGDICRSVFLCMTTDAVSDEWCVFKINFLYSHFVSFYFFVIIVTSPEICVGKCWMICDNKKKYATAFGVGQWDDGRTARDN